MNEAVLKSLDGQLVHTAPIEAKDSVSFGLGTRHVACANTPNLIWFGEYCKS